MSANISKLSQPYKILQMKISLNNASSTNRNNIRIKSYTS